MGYMLNKKQFNRGEELTRVYSSDKNAISNLWSRGNQSKVAKGKKPSSVYSRIKEAQAVGLVR